MQRATRALERLAEVEESVPGLVTSVVSSSVVKSTRQYTVISNEHSRQRKDQGLESLLGFRLGRRDSKDAIFFFEPDCCQAKRSGSFRD